MPNPAIGPEWSREQPHLSDGGLLSPFYGVRNSVPPRALAGGKKCFQSAPAPHSWRSPTIRGSCASFARALKCDRPSTRKAASHGSRFTHHFSHTALRLTQHALLLVRKVAVDEVLGRLMCAGTSWNLLPRRREMDCPHDGCARGPSRIRGPMITHRPSGSGRRSRFGGLRPAPHQLPASPRPHSSRASRQSPPSWRHTGPAGPRIVGRPLSDAAPR